MESRDHIKTNLEQINEKWLNEPCTPKRMLVKSIPNESGEMIEKIVRNKSGPLTLGYNEILESLILVTRSSFYKAIIKDLHRINIQTHTRTESLLTSGILESFPFSY